MRTKLEMQRLVTAEMYNEGLRKQGILSEIVPLVGGGDNSSSNNCE